MKKLVYILLTVVVFLSFTAVNVLAGEVDKAKEAEKTFARAVAQDSDSDLNIDAQNVSDDELKSVEGEMYSMYVEPTIMYGSYDGPDGGLDGKDHIDVSIETGYGIEVGNGVDSHGAYFSVSAKFGIGVNIKYYPFYTK